MSFLLAFLVACIILGTESGRAMLMLGLAIAVMLLPVLLLAWAIHWAAS